MATIQPKGEKIRQAVKWISGMIKEADNRPVYGLIAEAALKFNLSPREEDFLQSFYKEGTEL